MNEFERSGWSSWENQRVRSQWRREWRIANVSRSFSAIALVCMLTPYPFVFSCVCQKGCVWTRFHEFEWERRFFLWWCIWPVCLQKSLWCLYEECLEYIIDSDRNVEKKVRDRKTKTVSEMTWVFSSRLCAGLCMCLFVCMLALVVVHLCIRRF